VNIQLFAEIVQRQPLHGYCQGCKPGIAGQDLVVRGYRSHIEQGGPALLPGQLRRKVGDAGEHRL